MRFFKMPNSIFDYKLSPKAIFAYAYLISRMNILNAVTVSYSLIADNCHMDDKSAMRAIKELVNDKLIVKETRHDYRGKLKNKYIINRIAGNWFQVEYQLFRTEIKSTDFMVYCFIKKCMDSKHHEAFPSLNAIAKGTGISHSRVVTSVQYLRSYTFINRVRRHYRHTKAYRHNRYMLFRFQSKKKKTRLLERVFKGLKSFIAHFSSFKGIVSYKSEKVNRLYQNRGSPNFPHPL